jgi:hypothetical protein
MEQDQIILMIPCSVFIRIGHFILLRYFFKFFDIVNLKAFNNIADNLKYIPDKFDWFASSIPLCYLAIRSPLHIYAWTNPCCCVNLLATARAGKRSSVNNQIVSIGSIGLRHKALNRECRFGNARNCFSISNGSA